MMNPDKVTLFQLASHRLQWLSDRQRVVSENIANADTAQYRASEVQSFQSYLEDASGQLASRSVEVSEVQTSWGEDLTGNNIVLEEQLLLASDTAEQYRIAANLYRKAHELLLSVASGR